jgi:uncharacterized membrane protein YbhN (UPF0104 family)
MLVLYVLGTLAWAVRWRALLTLARLGLPLPFVWRVTLEAQAGGILLPGGVGGDALRIAAMVGRGVPGGTVAASVLLDRVVGLVTLATVAGILGVSTGGGGALGVGAEPLHDRGGEVTKLALVLLCVPFGFALGLAALRNRRIVRILSEGRLRRFTRDAILYVADPGAVGAILRALLASAIVSGVQLVVVHGLVVALGSEPSEPRWVYVGAAMSFIVAAVPVLPGGWGTSDAAFVFFLGLAGLPPSIALAVCLLYRAFWYLSGIVGALLRLAHRASPTNDNRS